MSIQKRFPAEWENQAAVQLTFPATDSDWSENILEVLPVFIKIVETIARFQPVIVVCEDPKATLKLLSHISETKLYLAKLPSNDTWARDHAGIIVLENNRPVVLDFMFNGWGLKFAAHFDNAITAGLSKKGIYNKVYSEKIRRKIGGLVLEGGSLETDGLGTLMTTEECLLSPHRNPQFSKKQIEAKLKKLLSLERILWLSHGALEGDDTDAHIDTLARFCDPHTICYQSCDNPNDSHYISLKKMETELRAFRQKDGSPYNMVALPWPTPCFSQKDGHRLPATYANFLIINNAVLVPTYRVKEDTAAINILQTCFPDRQIIGIDCRPIVEWHGSLHCLTMQWPAI